MPPQSRNKLLTKRINLNRLVIAEKYTKKSSFFLKVINDIIFNEKAQIVAHFKDHLILDDTSEFLKRFYNKSEILLRLNKIFGFYDSYSKIFPNYTKVKESKYLYKNIQKKQKMIDNLNDAKKSKTKLDKVSNEKLFDSKIYNSILNQTNQSIKNNNESNKETNYQYLETNMSFENLIKNIQEAENRYTIDVESSLSKQNPNVKLISNKINDKSKIFIKDKIGLNELNHEKHETIQNKEEMIKLQLSRKLSNKEKSNSHVSKLFEGNLDSNKNLLTTKRIINLPKTEFKMSKKIEEIVRDSSLKSIQNKLIVPKIINNYNLIENIQNNNEAPTIIISGLNNIDYMCHSKEMIKYNSNNNSSMNNIFDNNYRKFKSANNSTYRTINKSSKGSATKLSNELTGIKYKFPGSIKAESINRNQMKRIIHQEIIDQGIKSERSNFVSVLNKTKQIKNDYMTIDSNSQNKIQNKITINRGKSKETILVHNPLKENNEALKNIKFKNIPLNDILVGQILNRPKKENGYNTISPNIKINQDIKNPFRESDKLKTSRFYFNKTALKINNILNNNDQTNVNSERNKKMKF